jgi:FAD/FMN-containing dehydrogenase/Fe-S oxidoreductase
MKTSAEIQQELGPQLEGDCLTGDLALVTYSTAACIYKIRPLAVVWPRSAEDVAKVVRYGGQNALPVIPRGAGSGLAGQVLGQGIILDFTRHMNRVEEIRPEANYIRVQPGAILGKVNEQLKAFGKRIPQDPASEAMCSIGGNVGNNSGGLRAFKIGSTKHHVRGLQVVLADGTSAWIRPAKAGSPELAAMAADAGTFGRLYRETDKLLKANEALIARHRPAMAKNTAGYDLFSIYHDGLVDLTRLIVGSEGSLAVVTDVELNLMDLPKCAATALLYFDSLDKACQAVPEILKFDPIAVEFMEKNFLNIVRKDQAVPPEYLPDGAEAVLLVEFLRPTAEENRTALQAMVRRVADERRLAFARREAYDADEQAMLWALRKAALPILHKLPPPKEIVPFIEDSVVPPERLAEYIKTLWAIFERHGVAAAMFGHAGDANLHVRPLLDLRSQKDIDTMRSIAGEVADVALAMGGTLSGEHGDGRVRSAYLRRQFGPVYEIMRQVKRLWDPAGLLAPENVITERTELDTEHLKYGPAYRVIATGSDYDREHWRLEIEKCHGCATCLAHCPNYKATGSLFAGPRAKVNLLKAAITGELDFAKLSLDPEFKAVADACYNCKSCRLECPSGVDTPGLMLIEKAYWARHRGLPLADRLFSRARLMGQLGSFFAPFSNAIAGMKVVQKLNRLMLGIAERPLPQFARDNLEKHGPRMTTRHGLQAVRATQKPQFTAPGATAASFAAVPEKPASTRKVALFAGCFELFNDPASGRALMDVLTALGCEVVLPEQRCCGLPAYTSGNREVALRDMRFNVEALAPLVDAGYAVVSGCPSCVLSLKEDLPEALAEDADHAAGARRVAAATFDAHDYILRLLEEKHGGTRPAVAHDISSPDFVKMKLAYHAPCHLRAMSQGLGPKKMLERAGGLKFALTNTTCCGMGGTFGMKEKNKATSLAIGDDFFRRLKAAGIEAVVTPCGMCKTQIESGSGLRVYHPMELLAEMLKPTAGRS